MNKTRREIECLTRLQELNGSLEDIMEFLVLEGLLDKPSAKAIRLSSDVVKSMHNLLSGLSSGGKLQLLEYEWTILPVERIKILILTDKNNKEFTYNF